MQYSYNFTNEYEKFAEKVYQLLVENFSDTYFTGGTVRDMLLQRKIADIDIATAARPEEVEKILISKGVEIKTDGLKFGVVTALQNNYSIEIATLRTEQYFNSRFPEVTFISDIYQDSLRRDFTCNSLYFSHITNEIQDFHNGIEHIENKLLVFIGDPLERITEDPLRIVRAYRLATTLSLTIDAATEEVLQSNLFLLKHITETRLTSEINKIKSPEDQNKVLKVMHKLT